ncbi:L-erythro-3,5-diaminohexanoate dehydrogenase [Thermoactinomyces mirandus]|uniref:L-erythro-3,5-diaminohexanoate dehydrogenase n=1 Tax=Thermoactinomyces mirandus TaxID=2756294 RepID=A0A7W1XTD0_9BACL|nr:L-erythro-3,5-diaminohexanoate dehydrogenase [Thermoactinomyces mirandus]MBA4602908.1 L-erythro-3,5-diaminohexanoate dehydrogenase [Thermoactinomyces mirandus]
MVCKKGHHYGLHRVIEPAGVLPQPAWKLDPTPEVYDNECLIRVECLNIDSASFAQLKKEAVNDPDRIARQIMSIVSERGKMHNPLTGSGGILIGTVAEVGSRFPSAGAQPGKKIATLVSLTLTPLTIEKIRQVHLDTGQIDVDGQAVLFASCPFAILPGDIPEKAVLSVLDVCGAPAQTARLVKPQHRVVVLGAGGKSGLLSLYQAWKTAGRQGQVIAIEENGEACEEILSLNIAHDVICLDATNSLAVYEAVDKATKGALADLTINCVNVPDTELSAILATREGGVVYFFSMAVSFAKAALGAEGAGKDVQMMIGNGYAPGHASLALESLRECGDLFQVIVRRYG